MNNSDKIYKRQVLPAPRSAVSKGCYNLGTFNSAIENINLLEAKQPLGFPVPSFLNTIRLREWQAFQLGNEDHFFMIAVYNTKLVGLVHFSHYDIKRNKKTRYELQVPSIFTKIANGLYNSTSYYKDKKFSVNVRNKIDQYKIALNINAKNFKKNPDIQAQFIAHHHPNEMTPIVVCQPFSENRVMYSHKGLMPMEGIFTIGEETIVFRKEESWMIMDDHKGYYPRHTLYDWVTGATYKDGNRIGFNLTDNQVINKEEYNENCLWFNNEMHPLPPVRFERPNGFKDNWYIKDEYGKVDVVFKPSINTSIHRNFIIANSKYESPYGYFEGFLEKESGEKVDLSGVFGAGEQFDILI